MRESYSLNVNVANKEFFYFPESFHCLGISSLKSFHCLFFFHCQISDEKRDQLIFKYILSEKSVEISVTLFNNQ